MEKSKISREQDKATQNCETCGARHGIDKEIVICSGCCWVGYCSFTCQRNDWRKHKKVCLNKQKVCSPCDVGSGLTKSNEHKVFKSKIGNIVKMIAPAREEQRSQTLHMHCQVWVIEGKAKTHMKKDKASTKDKAKKHRKKDKACTNEHIHIQPCTTPTNSLQKMIWRKAQ